uniref:Lysozyme n=1 Tax=Rhodopseudomonas palustris (strain DX-1) TaxID=652103 RepID=E6VGI8_RHOPX
MIKSLVNALRRPGNAKKAAAGAGGLSAAGLALAIAMFMHWEGVSYVAKQLPFDPPGVITVCGGITNHDWPWLKAGMKFTPEECREAVAQLVPRYAEKVRACVPSFETMPPHRQAAITSFVINLGPGRVCNSSIGPDLEAGRIRQACDAMRKYVYANGKYLKGLDNRRNDPIWGERAWCLRED